MKPNVTRIPFDGLWLLSTLERWFSKGVCRTWSKSGVVLSEGLASMFWLSCSQCSGVRGLCGAAFKMRKRMRLLAKGENGRSE